MKVSVLASGSSGNVTYIETPKHRVLVDAGLSGKKVESLMHDIGRTLKDVDALFVTHEHSDHIKGVGVLARKYGMPVYANTDTWDAIGTKIGVIPAEQKMDFEPGKVLTLDDLDVESFPVSHDAANPQFYQFHHNSKAFAIVTDTGYLSDRLHGTLQNADAYLIEANHDVEMLRMGGYAWSLKQRILSDKGHLSNEDGALAAIDLLGNKTKQIYLGHLSKENNQKVLAHVTVEQIMQNRDIAVDHDFMLYDTDPEIATKLTVI
ncbi:MBL fold metallo-hydrolase [Periweissella cryptocerci]|uniref:MBL fold metallo-hydrolase n=1 Tax=Periweissella cryptocerci TaxID=2506420 RepID=A0A4P6YX52_9LACO|nr:MBL fold metallo-hydrolase [Periweissella cryptocerci]QBO37472.1 MBL fold metallo-hydrolase [Periweissella cryptocerci]